MSTRYFGQRIRRNEDPALLTDQALFTDDVYYTQKKPLNAAALAWRK